MTDHTQPAQLTDILRSLRRHWIVLVAAVVIGVATGALGSFVLPHRYEATAVVAVYPMKTDPLNASGDTTTVNMATAMQMAQSRRVAEAAADRLMPLHGIGATTITEAVSVEAPRDSQVLSVTFAGSSAAEASDGANEVGAAYLALRRSDAAVRAVRLEQRATKRVESLAEASTTSRDLAQRSREVQSDSLSNDLATLATLDLDPGRIVGRATEPRRPSTPGLVTLGLGGAVLGLIVGVPLALTRKESLSIGSADGLPISADGIVLDGTKDSDRAQTWDIAAFMLKIPPRLTSHAPFTIMVDVERPGGAEAHGKEFVDAMARRGQSARYVDAGAIKDGRISRGWPTEKKRKSWAGRIVVVDTSSLRSDADRVAVASRSNAVMLARSTDADAGAFRRLVSLLEAEGIDIDLTVVLPLRNDHSLFGGHDAHISDAASVTHATPSSS